MKMHDTQHVCSNMSSHILFILSQELTCRVHDECNGSDDVFGSDICTCRPYLTHAIEECIKTARKYSNDMLLEDDMLHLMYLNFISL